MNDNLKRFETVTKVLVHPVADVNTLVTKNQIEQVDAVLKVKRIVKVDTNLVGRNFIIS